MDAVNYYTDKAMEDVTHYGVNDLGDVNFYNCNKMPVPCLVKGADWFALKGLPTCELYQLSRPAGERKEDHTIDGVVTYAQPQGAKQMNYLEQETELATHYSANNNCFYIQESHIECFAMVLDDVGRWIYSDCTTNEELNGDEFFALDADQDNHKEDAHHIALQIEKLGNQPKNHIDLAISAGAVDDIVISPDEQIIEPWLADHLKGVGAIGVASDKPVFTQANANAGELPKGGDVVTLYLKSGNISAFYVGECKCGGQFICEPENFDGFDTYPFSVLSDRWILRDAMTEEMVTDEEFQEIFNMAEEWALKLLASDKFTISLKE